MRNSVVTATSVVTSGPPRKTYHLRTFFVALGVVALCLISFLFLVKLEAVVPATGIIVSPEMREVPCAGDGVLELGWYEAGMSDSHGNTHPARMDTPEGGGVVRGNDDAFLRFSGRSLNMDSGVWELLPEVGPRFLRLTPGDLVWPGQRIAFVKPLEENERGEGSGRGKGDCPRRERTEEHVVRVPATEKLWLVVSVRDSSSLRVHPGDVLAVVVPVDPATGEPGKLEVRLEIDEKDCGDLAVGQPVRIYSTMYNHRLHGYAEGRLDRIEPWGKQHGDDRRFFASAPIERSPVVLPLGSTCKAEVVVGRKRVYRIILEH